MRSVFVIVLLIASNTFMTLAWYGHLKFAEWRWFNKLGLVGIVLVSWGLALFEYVLQVPANKYGFKANGGPFSLIQLKVIQEVITLLVFVVFSMIFFKNESLQWNHYLAFLLLISAVYLVFI
jgi:uncharacterized protein